jgi:hypothetical protein
VSAVERTAYECCNPYHWAREASPGMYHIFLHTGTGLGLFFPPEIKFSIRIRFRNLDLDPGERERKKMKSHEVCTNLFLYQSIDLKFLHLIEVFVYFLNFVFVSNFSIFASQCSELTLSQSRAQRQYFFHWFYRGN